MSKPTPGPWIAEPSGDIRASMAGTGVGFVIASMNGRNGADEIRANARLIAAAPELLAALQAIVDQEQHDDNAEAHMHDMADIARAAIAKATGSAS